MQGQRETTQFRRKWTVEDDGRSVEQHAAEKLPELHQAVARLDALVMGEKEPRWRLIASTAPGMKTLTVEAWVWKLTCADRPALKGALVS